MKWIRQILFPSRHLTKVMRGLVSFRQKRDEACDKLHQSGRHEVR